MVNYAEVINMSGDLLNYPLAAEVVGLTLWMQMGNCQKGETIWQAGDVSGTDTNIVGGLGTTVLETTRAKRDQSITWESVVSLPEVAVVATECS